KIGATWKAVDCLLGYFQGQARFANPARTCESDKAHILPEQEFFGGSHFLFASNKCGPLCWQIAGASLRALRWQFREPVAYGREVPREVAGGGIPLVALLGQAPLHSPTKWSGGLRVQQTDGFWLFPEDCQHRLSFRALFVRALSSHHLVKH